ncbi:trinucleotide repeat-containing gene 6B protein-like isoform X2 [Boleophthalmus pectinirostris]|uniref:trinucleotide repeat-containing gene 6B protein-like isoform X2 n=1 Tax=Boleophthalmus pectinirostris TaxID=150288 RepID=UPI0024314E7D|nr:trinucleotide repeat-containing gene 6B protein-like isoform X2 [Boleophthalmus pectinirostris]
MEDKKKKKEEKKKRETPQKVPDQKLKVPESAKAPGGPSHTSPGSVSPCPGPAAPSSPSAASASAPVAPGAGNNAKQRTSVANGQPSSSSSSSSSCGSQALQQQRYMSREVPPRFRCQQDHKVLLKRGQPPLSSMLLGGGGADEAAAASGCSTQGEDNPNAKTAGATDSILGSSSPSPHNSSSSCVAAVSSSTITTTISTTSTYASSTWGAGSGSQPYSQGCGKVDGMAVTDWPKACSEAVGEGTQEQDHRGNNNNSSASWSETSTQQKGVGEENMDNSSPPSPISPSTSLNECAQSGGVVASQVEVGQGSAAIHNSKVSHLFQESPGANSNPSSNSSARHQQPGTTASACDGLPLHSSVISSFSASSQLITTNSSVSQAGAPQQQHTGTALGARSGEQQQAANLATESVDGIGPNTENGEAKQGEESTTLSSSTAAAAASSWRAMPPIETGAQGKEGNSWGLDGGSNTQVVSQGAQVVCSPKGDWGSTVGGGSLGHLAIGSGKGEDGSSSGDSVVTDSASPKFATMSKAWDNQKGAESDDGKVGEWGAGGSKGEGSTAGSSGGGQKTDRTGHRQSHQINADVALQSMLSRSDLDPRVLSNTGWGQTQIRQNVAWNLNTPSRNDKSTSLSSANVNTSTSRGANNPGSSSVREGWDGGRTSHDVENEQGKAEGGWGVRSTETQGKGWGNEEQWADGKAGGKWGEFGKQGTGWEEGPEDKGTGGWKNVGQGGETGGWGGEWGQRDSASGRGWSDGPNRGENISEEGSAWSEGGPHRGGWGGGELGEGKSLQNWGNAKPHTASAQIPNSQVAPMKAPTQQHQSQGQPPGAPIQGGWGSRSTPGEPPSKNPNQSTGWTSGPIPQIPGATGDSLEPSGWEEPSPQSISRKMDIDDGTAAWGDPNRYNTKNVNLWDKNAATAQSHSQQPPPMSMQPPAQRRQQGPQQTGPGLWGGGAQCADNGTGSWGQTSEAATGWGDSDESSKHSGWGNPSSSSAKSGTKSIENWGGKGEGSMAASRHSSWDEDDDCAGGVWNNAGSQGSSSSYNSGGWAHGGKRGNLKGGGGDNWINPMSRQFSNMGLLGDDPNVDRKLESEKRGIGDYNGDIRRGGRGGVGYRMPGPKDMGSADMGPYGEKMGSHGVAGSSGGMPQPRGMHQPGMHPLNPTPGLRAQVPHQFLSAQVPGPVLKQMPSPGGSMGGVVGGVGSVGGVGGVGGGVFPPQISPQQLAMLSNIYPHMQQFHLACQLLLQHQQQPPQQPMFPNQRKFPQPQPVRQQSDPQQLARIMAILQQQRQQQQTGVGGQAPIGGNSKLSPSHLGGGISKQSIVDPLQHPGMGGPLSDIHAKSQGMYSGMELSSVMGGMKDTGGQQSRFKWMMEGHSPVPSPPDLTLNKNGPLPGGMKVRGGSPYSQYDMLAGDALGIPPQGAADSWHRTPGSKLGHKPATSSWPPEFQPGVPWKGIQSSGDPESDPYMTPGGSVLGSPGPPGLNDTDHQLLRDNIGPNPSLNTSLPSPVAWPYSASDSPLSNAHSTGKYSEYKPSWPPEPIGQNKMWKTNRNSSQLPRPPPGLTNQKQASPSPWGSGGPRLARSWGGGGVNQDSRFGQAWSDGTACRSSCWLLLSNLTPQIDGSTLRTICMQHGPLLTFHLGLTQGSALIRYSSRQEAAKAQGALHMCVLGNTTILAEFVSEEEVARYFAHSQAGGECPSPGTVVAGGAQSSSGSGVAVASSGGSSPGSERASGGTASSESGSGGAGDSGAGLPGVRSSSSWQNLDGTGTSSETLSAQGSGLGIFSQWSTNGAGEGTAITGVESGRSGLWGSMTAGYPSSSSLWGAPQIEERHQMDSPAALLPGDLLGGGADSI